MQITALCTSIQTAQTGGVWDKMTRFSSDVDEFGTNNRKISLRDITDIAEDKGSYYLLKEGINQVTRDGPITQDKPLILRASQNVVFDGCPDSWTFTGSNQSMFSNYPLKTGDIVNFSDNTTSTLVNTSAAHNLNVNDIVTIIDSRVGEYNGPHIVVSIPTTTSFEIAVTFNGADGQCRFTQSSLDVSTLATSADTHYIQTTTLTDGGSDYEQGETVTIKGQSSSQETATAVVNTITSIGTIRSITITDEGSGYTNGETCILTGQTSGAATAFITITTGNLTTLTLNNHGLDDDIAINLGGTLNADGTYVVKNSTTNTIDIDLLYDSSNTSGTIDVGHGSVEFRNERLQNGSYPTWNKFIDLEPAGTAISGALLMNSTPIIGFELETRNQTAVKFSPDCSFVNCGGYLSVNDVLITIDGIGVFNTISPFDTKGYAPAFRVSNGSFTQLKFESIGFLLSQYESGIEVPPTISDFASIQISDNGDIGSADFYSKGYTAVSTGAIASAASGANITIPVDSTIRFREGDTIEILDSTSYTGSTGTIVSSGITKDTSIQVDIAYVAADFGIILVDTSLASLQQDDTRFVVSGNDSVPNSTTTINTYLDQASAQEVSGFSVIGTPLPIDGTWAEDLLERFTLDTTDGKVTYEGIEDIKVKVDFGADIQAIGSVEMSLHILKNGTDVTVSPPMIDEPFSFALAELTGFQAVSLSHGDTLQLGAANNTNLGTALSVVGARMTVTKIA